MTCNQATHLIQTLLDSRLTKDERTLLDAHIAECETCAQDLIAMRRLVSGARQWAKLTPADDPGDAFDLAVMAAITAEEQVAEKPRSLILWQLAVAIVFACIILPLVLLPVSIIQSLEKLINAPQKLSWQTSSLSDWTNMLASSLNTIRDLPAMIANIKLSNSLPISWLIAITSVGLILNMLLTMQTRNSLRKQPSGGYSH